MSDAPEPGSAEPALIRETGFLNRTVTLAHRGYRYQVYVPRSYTALESWPLILFLHGAGERGEDGLRQTQIGLAAAIRCHVERFPAIVVFPQALTDASWNTAEMSGLAIAAMQQTMRDFRVDPRRVYLTGLSMGGTGVWSIAARHPGLFAALAPICGALHFPAAEGGAATSSANLARCANYARRIDTTPVWIFHGAEDPIVPVEYARQMAKALKARGCPVLYTEYPQDGHAIWDRVYADEDFCTWLFAQRRPD
jgi:predicted peptidase